MFLVHALLESLLNKFVEIKDCGVISNTMLVRSVVIRPSVKHDGWSRRFRLKVVHSHVHDKIDLVNVN